MLCYLPGEMPFEASAEEAPRYASGNVRAMRSSNIRATLSLTVLEWVAVVRQNVCGHGGGSTAGRLLSVCVGGR